MHTSTALQGQRESLVEAALFYLMSQFARNPNAWVAYAVVEHLHMLTRHFSPDADKHSVYAGLLPLWEALVPQETTAMPGQFDIRNVNKPFHINNLH